MSRLRLAAACALLKLAQEPCYHEIITLEQYQLCALVINVRSSRQPKLVLSILFFIHVVLFIFFFSSLQIINKFLLIADQMIEIIILTSKSLIPTVFCASRTSATRCDSVFPRSSTEACAASACRWSTWQCSLCVPRTPSKRGGPTLASVWSKTSTFAESTSNNTPPSVVRNFNQICLVFQKKPELFGGGVGMYR